MTKKKRIKKSKLDRKKYAVIIKYIDYPTPTEHFYKVHCNDLLKLTEYLDTKCPRNPLKEKPWFSGWKWFNVYEHRNNTGVKLASFTINNRPTQRDI